ncbi:MAG: hypothetical protein ACTHME_08615, partial [Candidatus Nitrosocosmicus sp.]
MSETTSVNSFEDIDIENLVKGDKDVTDIIDDEIDAEIIDDVSEDEEDKEIKAIDDELDKKEKDKEDEVERAKKRVGKDGHPITENYI